MGTTSSKRSAAETCGLLHCYIPTTRTEVFYHLAITVLLLTTVLINWHLIGIIKQRLEDIAVAGDHNATDASHMKCSGVIAFPGSVTVTKDGPVHAEDSAFWAMKNYTNSNQAIRIEAQLRFQLLLGGIFVFVFVLSLFTPLMSRLMQTSAGIKCSIFDRANCLKLSTDAGFVHGFLNPIMWALLVALLVWQLIFMIQLTWGANDDLKLDSATHKLRVSDTECSIDVPLYLFRLSAVFSTVTLLYVVYRLSEFVRANI